MVSVQDAVNDIEMIFKVPHAKAKAIARKLIDDGVLPKSSGSRIASITPEHFCKLLFASIISQKVNDATKVAESYYSLELKYINKRDGETPYDIARYLENKAGEFLARIFRDHISALMVHEIEKHPFEDWQVFGHIDICTSSEEITFVSAWKAENNKSRENNRITFGIPNAGRDQDYFSPKMIISIPSLALVKCATHWIVDDVGVLSPTVSEEARRTSGYPVNESDKDGPVRPHKGKAGGEPDTSIADAIEEMAADIKREGSVDIWTMPVSVSDSAFVRTVDYISKDGFPPRATRRAKLRTYPKIPPRKL